MKQCEGHLKQAEFDLIIKKIYGDISPPHSKTDSESSSLCYVDIFMEMVGSFIDKEVLSYDHIILDENCISKLRSNNKISSTR